MVPDLRRPADPAGRRRSRGVKALLTRRPRGTGDLLPPAVYLWQRVEAVARDVCARFGYREIRTPVIEHTELFRRTAGEATDVVQKEMYTFEDRAGRSLTLRPEGTAPVCRAYLEEGLQAWPQPVKLYYLAAPMFRYERPQAGRYRQHHQFGVEALGAADPALDAEVVDLAVQVLSELGLGGLEVRINSIGDARCRPAYRDALRAYYADKLDALCSDCRRRYEVNPLRLLDCKQEACRAARAGAPRTVDYLCAECREHFGRLQDYLAALGLRAEIDPTLVRGFDYYTRTVFEIVHTGLGAQNAVCGGGRYDGLVEVLGGPPTPGVGFGMGLERLVLTVEQAGMVPEPPVLDVFVVTLGEQAREAGVRLVHGLRRAGLAADTDYLGRSLKAQLRHAARYPARFALLVGEAELAAGRAALRDLERGTQVEVALDDLQALAAAVRPQEGVRR